jgi:diacylglycerol kinase family enzyme
VSSAAGWSPGLRRFLVIANAAAGTASDDNTDAAIEVLRVGAEVTVCRTSSLAELAEAVTGCHEDCGLVALGGDGSLHAIAQALHDAGMLSPDRPIGLLPLGTGNDLARTLGLPLDPAAAAKVVLGGRARPLDLLVDDAGGVVVNAVHAGVGAEAGATAEDWKPRLGIGAYAVGGLVAGLASDGWWVRVTVDGNEVHDGAEPVLMVGLGNGRTIGGGSPLAPSAVPDDGLVDVVVSRAVGALARLRYAVDLRSGEHVRRADVDVVRGREVTLAGKPFRCNADGEISDPLTARSWRVLSGCWSILVPTPPSS